MRGEGKEVFGNKMSVLIREQKSLWGWAWRLTMEYEKDKGVFNLLYNTKNHLCFKSPIIHYPEQPSI